MKSLHIRGDTLQGVLIRHLSRRNLDRYFTEPFQHRFIGVQPDGFSSAMVGFFISNESFDAVLLGWRHSVIV